MNASKTVAQMPNPASAAPLTMDILLQRQIDNRTSGNCAYLETFLRAARAGGFRTRVIFAPVQSFGNRPWASVHPQLATYIDETVWPISTRIGQRYVSLSPHVWGRFVVRLAKEAFMRMGISMRVRSYLGERICPEDARRVAAVCNARPADVTMAEYSSTAPALDHLTEATVHACLMHDLLSARADRFRQAGQEPDFDPIPLEAELGWIANCDLLVFASADELATVRKYFPQIQSVWLPPDAPDYVARPKNGPPRVVFIGTKHAGNEDALKHFIADIWPLVRAAQPETEFWVAGSIGAMLSPEEASQPGVRVLGRVDDLGELGGSQSVAIAPTRLATGVSIKLAEYLVLRMPSVAYPLALEGFGDALNDLVRTSASSEDFAAEVIGLLNSETVRLEMSRRAGEKISARLSCAPAAELMARAARTARSDGPQR